MIVVLIHERGLRAMNARSTLAHARNRRRRMWLSYAGIAVATLSVVSSLQYWSMEYFWVHMVQHVSVMLGAPALYVAGSPALPLLHAVPIRLRRRFLQRLFLRRTPHPLRVIGRFLLSPIVAIGLFNVVMVFWMLPSVFNPIMGRPSLHIGLMLTSFFLSGVLFWLQFIPSRPWRPTLSPFAKVGALLVTNLVMTIIAMSLSFFASGAFYDIGNSMLNMPNMASMTRITLNPLADQQIGAAILWVCGDFWCLPALLLAFRQATHDESGSQFIDRILRGRHQLSVEEFRGSVSEKTTP